MAPPTEGKPLNAEERRLAIANIRGYVFDRRLLTVSNLARMAGVSASTVSEALKGKYKGDLDNVLRKCDAAIADYTRHEDAPAAAQFVKTEFAQRLFGLLKLAAKRRTMAALYAVSGTGKTMALQAAVRLDFQNAIYLEVNAGCSSPKNLLKALLAKLYRGDVSGVRDRAEMFNLIVERLRNSGRMIIIDEADSLPAKSLNDLRQIHDATGSDDTRCPIVLVGRPNLRDSLKRTFRCPEIGGSLGGRFGIDRSLMPTAGSNPTDGGKWLFGVDEIMQMLARRRIQITRDAAKWLTCLANISLLSGGMEGGGLRIAIQVALNAATLNKDGGPITREMLVRAHRISRDPEGAAMMENMIDQSAKYVAATAAAS